MNTTKKFDLSRIIILASQIKSEKRGDDWESVNNSEVAKDALCEIEVMLSSATDVQKQMFLDAVSESKQILGIPPINKIMNALNI